MSVCRYTTPSSQCYHWITFTRYQDLTRMVSQGVGEKSMPQLEREGLEKGHTWGQPGGLPLGRAESSALYSGVCDLELLPPVGQRADRTPPPTPPLCRLSGPGGKLGWECLNHWWPRRTVYPPALLSGSFHHRCACSFKLSKTHANVNK